MLSPVWLLGTPWAATHQAPLSSTISRSLLKFMSIESVMLSTSPPLSFPSFTFSLSQHQDLFQSQLFTSGGQCIGDSASASASVLAMDILCWFPLVLTGLISLQCKGPLRVFSSTTLQKQLSIPQLPAFFMVQFSYLYTTTEKRKKKKKHGFDYMDLCWQCDGLCFLIFCLDLS